MNSPIALSDRLIAVGFERYSGTFADSQEANNKLELDYDRLCRYPKLLDRVVDRMCDLAEGFEPEFVAGVPDGATGLANRVAYELGRRQDNDIHCIYLGKCVVMKDVFYRSKTDEKTIKPLQRGLLIEDVFNRGANTERALRVDGLAPKIVAVIANFNRGFIEERKPIDKPVYSVVSRPIPALLPEDSGLWVYADARARATA